jgi:hypothetical protein
MTATYPHVEECDLDAATVVTRWMDCVNAGDVAGVTSLYASHAVLLPTFSPHTITSEEQREEYFKSLASRKGLQVSLHAKTLRVMPLSETVKVACGIYRFSFEVDEEPLTFEARFSFAINITKPRPIEHHHSSQVPRTLA